MTERPSQDRPGGEEHTDPSGTGRAGEPTADQPVTGERDASSKTSEQNDNVPDRMGSELTAMRPAGATGGVTAASEAPAPTGGRRGVTAVMVVVALIVGALIGGGVVAATRSNDEASSAGTGPISSPTEQTSSVGTTASPSTTVVISALCLQLSDDAQAIVDLSTQAAAAARDLNASKLSSIVRRLDAAQQVLRDDTAACRAA